MFQRLGPRKKRLTALPLINKASLTFLERQKKSIEKIEKDSRKFNDNKTYLQTKRACDDLKRIAIGKKQKIEKIHKEPGQSNRQLSITTVTNTEEQDKSNLQTSMLIVRRPNMEFT